MLVGNTAFLLASIYLPGTATTKTMEHPLMSTTIAINFKNSLLSTGLCLKCGLTAPMAEMVITEELVKSEILTVPPIMIGKRRSIWCANWNPILFSLAMPAPAFDGWAMKRDSLARPTGIPSHLTHYSPARAASNSY